MLKNILLDIEYDGTNYFGWQIQNIKEKAEVEDKKKLGGRKLRTVQEEVEKAIEKLFNRKIRVTCSGRTDRGVHAKSQCVNFKANTRIPLKNIKGALNAFLPDDIRIRKVKFVSLNFHARFSAKSKVYRYIIMNRKEPSVFLNRYVWHLPQNIDIERMRKASSYLKGKKDFSCFAKESSKYKSCVRKMLGIAIKKNGKYIYIDMEASGFLRNMARNIVSFLVMTGMGQILQKDIRGIIKGRIRYTNNPAPPGGLYLMKVNYE
ncbi:MAG: tRNA pseudouridine(38-40) synthase TruA [Candidatus Omnitrophica bacterium 4484_171]|nr:MAG: tRNA pseudouridine(38-40) synthase TruA [Candidatus Omnitrophica bacterium 4484_171]